MAGCNSNEGVVSCRKNKMIEVKRMKTENAWKKYADKKPVFDFCEGYKEFMSLCKTERECTDEIIKQAKKPVLKILILLLKKEEL